MPKVTEAIQSFFMRAATTHNAPELLARWSSAMETQVNVSAGRGVHVDGKKSTYTDGVDTWWNIRIPKNANAIPHFSDYEMRWPLEDHVEAIGSTGWDWVERKSRWVAFDFDSISGHAAGIGVTDDQLNEVRAAASALTYVEARKSTGGGGIHLYVYLDGITTANHTEHAALARAILGMMSSAAEFDFGSSIDACGGNMWLWHKKINQENQGLKLLKAATRVLSESDLPQNWRDHVDVINKRRAKVRVNGVADDGSFAALTASRRIIPLIDSQKSHIEALSKSGFSTIWVPDHHLLQAHTFALQDLMNDTRLNIAGIFKTNSQGKDPGTPNCFLFPLENGAWKVYRFSPGIQEAETWEQDGQGWTTCYFNKTPSLRVASRASGGKEDEKGNYVFKTVSEAAKAAEALGNLLEVPKAMRGRQTKLKASKDGRLVVSIKKNEGDEGMDDKGWLGDKHYWTQIFSTRAELNPSDHTLIDFDGIIRALSSPDGRRAGWSVRQVGSKAWRFVPKDDVKSHLLGLTYTRQETDAIIGRGVGDDWTLVNLPFQEEYPGNRQWNRDAAQFAFLPAELGDDEAPSHEHWDRILSHVGQDLDLALSKLQWAKDCGIKTGRDYLLAWVACMLREPFQPLPYLFFYGEKQNSGKSMFHEAVAMLMTKGAASAKHSLTNQNGFNGELANVVLAYIEETDISKSPGAYNRLKEWTTGKMLWIRKMRTDAYAQANTLHFVHSANGADHCPVFSEDTRIVVAYVPCLAPGQEIPKSVLTDRLLAEAPHFMRTLMDMPLPPVMGRMRLPVVETQSKQLAQASNRNPLEAFIQDECYEVPGEMITFAEFYDRFIETVSGSERMEWHHKQKVIRSMPVRFPYGTYTNNRRCFGNISWSPADETEERKSRLVAEGDRLVFEVRF